MNARMDPTLLTTMNTEAHLKVCITQGDNSEYMSPRASIAYFNVHSIGQGNQTEYYQLLTISI